MDMVKSGVVLLCLLLMVIFSITLVVKRANKYRNGHLTKTDTIYVISFSCLTIICWILFGNYIYPFERTLEPVLIAEFDVPEEYHLDYPGQRFWHGAYEEYGLYAESFYFNPDDTQSVYGFGWPPMNFKKYNYIITYGQSIKKISYNVWDTIDEPVRTGAHAGHMVLEDEFKPEKVYVYQIPKIRIENDVNDIDRPWD